MKTNKIGKTDVHVTEVSFGCSGIGNLFRIVEDADCQAILERAWDFGIRYFDTAPHYGRGLSELRLRPFLKARPRDSFVLSSKVGRLLTPGAQRDAVDGFINPLPNDAHFDYSGEGIENSFNQSCARMGVSRIDVVYVHDIGTETHGMETNATHLRNLMATGFERLLKLKHEGRIGAIGIGVNEVEICLELLREMELDAILLAGRLTLLDRSAEEKLVPLCRKLGVSLVLGGIFNSGILAKGPVESAQFDYAPAPPHILEKVRALQAEAAGQNKTLALAALEFAPKHEAAASVLLGTSDISSLNRNLENVKVIQGGNT